MEEIYDIMSFYSKKNQHLSNELIYYLFKYFIEEKNLEDYVQQITFTSINQKRTNHKSNNTMMAYDSFNNRIIVDNDKLYDWIRLTNKSTLKEYLDTSEFNLYIITYLLNIILHELEHANQLKMSNENKYNFENHLFKLCLNNTNEFKKFGNKNYAVLHMLEYRNKVNNLIYFNKILSDYDNNSPMERFANIHASNDIIKMLKLDDEHTKKLQKIWSKRNIKYSINGYNFNDSMPAPTFRYLKDLACIELIDPREYQYFKRLVESHNLSLESRLKYGLDITEEEHQKILQLIK